MKMFMAFLILGLVSQAIGAYEKKDVGDPALIESRAAPVKSMAQLNSYLQVFPDFPINRLPNRDKQSFMQSLVFTDRGLGSYSYIELINNLSISEIYEVLTLFGSQSTISGIPNIERLAASLSDEAVLQKTLGISSIRAGDRICYSGSKGCTYSFGDVCNERTCNKP